MEWVSGKIHYCGDGDFMPSIMPFRANPHKIPDWMSENDHLTPSQLVSSPNRARDKGGEKTPKLQHLHQGSFVHQCLHHFRQLNDGTDVDALMNDSTLK